jgi:hypothetical protein
MSEVKSLIIAPFDATGSRVKDTVQRALREVGVTPLSIDEAIQPGALWAQSITEAIRTSDFIVADLSRQNPNVVYEVGFAHALRKPTIILMSQDSTGELPTDLAGFQYIAYDPANLRSLQEQVSRAASVYLRRRGEE